MQKIIDMYRLRMGRLHRLDAEAVRQRIRR